MVIKEYVTAAVEKTLQERPRFNPLLYDRLKKTSLNYFINH